MNKLKILRFSVFSFLLVAVSYGNIKNYYQEQISAPTNVKSRDDVDSDAITLVGWYDDGKDLDDSAQIKNIKPYFATPNITMSQQGVFFISNYDSDPSASGHEVTDEQYVYYYQPFNVMDTIPIRLYGQYVAGENFWDQSTWENWIQMYSFVYARIAEEVYFMKLDYPTAAPSKITLYCVDLEKLDQGASKFLSSKVAEYSGRTNIVIYDGFEDVSPDGWHIPCIFRDRDNGKDYGGYLETSTGKLVGVMEKYDPKSETFVESKHSFSHAHIRNGYGAGNSPDFLMWACQNTLTDKSANRMMYWERGSSSAKELYKRTNYAYEEAVEHDMISASGKYVYFVRVTRDYRYMVNGLFRYPAEVPSAGSYKYDHPSVETIIEFPTPNSPHFGASHVNASWHDDYVVYDKKPYDVSTNSLVDEWTVEMSVVSTGQTTALASFTYMEDFDVAGHPEWAERHPGHPHPCFDAASKPRYVSFQYVYKDAQSDSNGQLVVGVVETGFRNYHYEPALLNRP